MSHHDCDDVTLLCIDMYYKSRHISTATVPKKVVGLEWKVYDDDDLSSGLHSSFSVGYMSTNGRGRKGSSSLCEQQEKELETAQTALRDVVCAQV